jgi:hypothetical protein
MADGLASGALEAAQRVSITLQRYRARMMKKILLAEDNPFDLELALAGFHYRLTNEVVVARDGAETLII